MANSAAMIAKVAAGPIADQASPPSDGPAMSQSPPLVASMEMPAIRFFTGTTWASSPAAAGSSNARTAPNRKARSRKNGNAC